MYRMVSMLAVLIGMRASFRCLVMFFENYCISANATLLILLFGIVEQGDTYILSFCLNCCFL